WAMRQLAPTNLTMAGIMAGRAAGGMSAFAYSLHCTDDSFPFIALWYSLTIALCAVLGGVVGRQLLRWLPISCGLFVTVLNYLYSTTAVCTGMRQALQLCRCRAPGAALEYRSPFPRLE